MKRLAGVALSLVCASGLSATGAPTPTTSAHKPAKPTFVDAGPAATPACLHASGKTGALDLPEIMGPGIALFDYDRDGDLDVYCVQGGQIGPAGNSATAGAGDRVFRNDLDTGPNGPRARFVDVTQAMELKPGGYGMGVAVGDYDGDGFDDVYVTGYRSARLLRNVGGRRFEDVTAHAGVGDTGLSVSATFFDYDRDGNLDLFVARYVEYTRVRCLKASTRPDYCGPSSFRPQPDRLFHNRGDGRFEDVSARMLGAHKPGPGLGVIAFDANGDGWLDLAVANDGAENHLWLNQAGRAFREDGLFAGVALNRGGLPEAGMGIVAGDLDDDGDEDLFLTHLTGETNTLYINQGDGLFEDASLISGLGPPSLPWTGFGTAFFDHDNDGVLDAVVVNGAVRLPDDLPATDARALAQPRQFFRGLGAARFRDASAEAGPEAVGLDAGRGLAAGDVDNDGDIDLLIANVDGPTRLLLNTVGQDRPWLGLRLLRADGRGDALGALVLLRRRVGPSLTRRVRRDGSYASAGDARLLFGLGAGSEVTQLEVTWPDGSREAFPAPALQRYSELRQGTGRALAPGPGAGTGSR